VYASYDPSQQSDNCGAVAADSLGSELLVSASHSQPQDMPAEQNSPAAIWRLRRQIAVGNFLFCSHVLGLRMAR
jgi:hypothetical protein